MDSEIGYKSNLNHMAGGNLSLPVSVCL